MSELDLGSTPTAPAATTAAAPTAPGGLVLAPPAPVPAVPDEQAAGAVPVAEAQTRVANTLVDLRATVTELDPNRADLGGAKKILKWIPGGDKIQRYFAKYESAQSHLNAIIKSLESGQDELRKDN